MNLLSPIIQTETAEDHAKKRIFMLTSEIFQQMKITHNEVYRTVWKHPSLTPQQVLDALGTNAASLFVLGADQISLILKYDPSFPEESWKPPFKVIFNEDGTVTVTDIPYDNP